MDAIPSGVYEVEVVKAEERPSKSSAFPVIYWFLQVVDGEYKGARLTLMNTLNPAGAFKIKETLNAMGEVTAKKKDMEIELNDYIGKKFMVEVGITKRQGTDDDVNEILRCFRPGSGPRNQGANGVAAAAGAGARSDRRE